jgi:hypothetical protein
MAQEQRAGIELYYKIQAQSKRVVQWFQQQWQKIKGTLGDTAAVLSGTSRQLQQVAPYVQQNAQFAADMGASYEQVVQQFGRAAAAAVDWQQAASRSAQINQELAQATELATEQIERQTAARAINLKRLLLWGIGAASAYRAYMQIRRALQEGYRDLFKNTEEYKRLTEASDEFKRSLILSIATIEQYKGLMSGLADVLDRAGDAMLQGSAKQQAINQLIEESTDRREKQLLMAMRAGRVIGTVAERTEVAAKVQERANQIYRESKDAIEEAGDAYDDLADRIERSVQSWREGLAEQYRDRYIQRLDDMRAATISRLESMVDAWRSYRQRIAEIGTQHTDDLADLAIDIDRRTMDIWTSYYDALEDLQAEAAGRQQELQSDHYDRLFKIEMDYAEKVRRIQEDYAMEMWEAVGERDATAALKAQRRRNLELARAGRDREKQRKEAGIDYRDRLDDLERYQQDRRREIEQDHRRELRDLQTYEQRKRQDLQESHRRRLRDLQTAHNWRLQAIQEQYRAETIQADAHYYGQEQRYINHLQRMLQYYQWYYNAILGITWTTKPGDPKTGPYDSYFWQRGGSFIATRPQTIHVGEGGRPELVQVIPLSGAMQHRVDVGDVRHQVGVAIEQSIAGYEGRINAAVVGALRELFR